MKLVILTLVASLFIVSASLADTFDNSYENAENDFALFVQDMDLEPLKIEARSIISRMYFVFKNALRTVKALKCTIQEVLATQSITQDYFETLKACGGEVTEKMQKLIDACNDILQTCKEILNIHENICGNSGDVSNAKTSRECYKQLFRKIDKLYKQIKYAVKLIKQIKKVPGDMNECYMNAINTLEDYYVGFPQRIIECSQLSLEVDKNVKASLMFLNNM